MTEQHRVIALDIDGTILDFDGRLTDRVRDAVKAVAAQPDRHVVLATGRSLAATSPVAERLGITDGYAVTSNGAITIRLDPLQSNPLPANPARLNLLGSDPREPLPGNGSGGGYHIVDYVDFDPTDALLMLREHLPTAIYAVEDAGLSYRLTAPFPNDELIGDLSYVPFNDLLGTPVTRVVVRSPEHTTQDFLDVVHRLGLTSDSYTVGWTAWLDIAPGGVSKAHGLHHVVTALGFTPADVLAVGDGSNDVEMFGWAGRSVAMGQAPPNVQAAADEVCGSVTDDGLADVLERFLA